jgi:DNA-binding NarL/FixJ family response regulator
LSLRAFIVEDHPILRSDMVAMLEDLANVEVVGCFENETSAKAWLQIQETEKEPGWDLGIVDLFLREGSGLGVITACQQRLKHQKVVLMSNFAVKEVRDRCLQLGADAVFDKSNEIDALLDYCRMVQRAWANR